MARAVEEVRVAAGGGDVWFAPVGTRLPRTVTERLDAAFVNGGYITTEGATVSWNPDLNELEAFQERLPIRVDITRTSLTARWSFMQQNPKNLVFAFGGGTVDETVPGEFGYVFPSDASTLTESAVVIESLDGTKPERFVIPRGIVSEGVETQWSRTEASLLPVTFRALGGTGNSPYWRFGGVRGGS